MKKQNPQSFARQFPFAKKSFGQNFLVDENYIEKILSALNPEFQDTIIEIGPGRGAITEKLLQRAKKVVAIELDKDLIPFLTEKFDGNVNFQLIESDALKIDFGQLIEDDHKKTKIKLVANLPYNISTAILQKLILQRQFFSEMVLMFQREVVERITAKAGNTERGFLTVLVEAYLHAEKLFDVPPNAFRPAPKVWSTVARLKPKNEYENLLTDDKLFREIISLGFQQKRKTIINNLKKASGELAENIESKGDLTSILEQTGIEPNRRAETLKLEDWTKLANLLAEKEI